MVESHEESIQKDLVYDLFDCIQEDDGVSDDEADSFKAASEQAYKQHLEEQSRRQSLRPQTAPTRPQTPSSADRKRRAVEQANERFRVRPETPRVDYIPPARPITGPEIDHAAWGAWLSPGCSYTQLMGPKSARPATAHAPRKATEGFGLEWRDVVGRVERGRQPWQDVKPCDVSGPAAKETTYRQACGEEPQFGAAASPRAAPSPYISSPQISRRPFSASVADKRRRMQSKTSQASPAVRESPLRRRKESAGTRFGRSAERRAAANSQAYQSSDGRDVPAGSGMPVNPPERLAGQQGAAERPADWECADSVGADSGALKGSVQRNVRGTAFMAAIEERLNGMSITETEAPRTNADNLLLVPAATQPRQIPASNTDTSDPGTLQSQTANLQAADLRTSNQQDPNLQESDIQAPYLYTPNQQVFKSQDPNPGGPNEQVLSLAQRVPTISDGRSANSQISPAHETDNAQKPTTQIRGSRSIKSESQPATVQEAQEAQPTSRTAPPVNYLPVRSDTGAEPPVEHGLQSLDVRIAESALPETETDSRTLCTFPARPFTAGVTRPGPMASNPTNPSRPATAPVKPCIPSLSESFSRMGLGSLEGIAGTYRSDSYTNPLTGRSSAGKAPSAYARRVMAPPQFVQLTPWDAKMVDDVMEKVNEANKLSRALGLSVRYSIFQNAKSDVWVEVYEARTRLTHAAAEEQSARAEELDWRRSIEDPAEAAALSAVRNADAKDPADEYRGPKLRDISVDVFLRTHRRLHRSASDARFRGFLSLAEERNDRRRKPEPEEKKELWEELGVNEGFAKILSKAREQAIQNKHSIASSGRDVAVRGRLIGATERGVAESVGSPPKGLEGFYQPSKTSANVAKALGTMSSFGLSMGQRQESGLFMTGRTELFTTGKIE